MKAKALVIGNANYHEGKLENPISDANDIGSILKRLGFEVDIHTDLNRVEQDVAITDFVTSLNKFQVGLFYFAGHGFQLNNENYLAAIDTSVIDEPHARNTAFPLKMLLEYLNETKNDTTIIILDACRSNLTTRSWYRTISNAGLAPIHAPKGTLIAFATSPGNTASDGTGTRNGVYTSALLQHIATPHVQIEEMFKRVRSLVYKLTKGKQTSWEHTSMTSPFYFNRGQLAHSSIIEYATYAIQDHLYIENRETAADALIQNLKSRGSMITDDAIDQIELIDVKLIDKNKLFLIGRYILQSAERGSKPAIKFMENLPISVKGFQVKTKNHLLNGISYEMYFDSQGNFRVEGIKDWYLEAINATLEMKEFKASLMFIREMLEPYREMIFYIPSNNKSRISVDLRLSKVVNKRYTLQNIKYKDHDILFKNENDYWGVKEQTTYDDMNYEELRKRIAYLMHVPLKKLNIKTSIPISLETIFRFPTGYRIKK